MALRNNSGDAPTPNCPNATWRRWRLLDAWNLEAETRFTLGSRNLDDSGERRRVTVADRFVAPAPGTMVQSPLRVARPAGSWCRVIAVRQEFHRLREERG